MSNKEARSKALNISEKMYEALPESAKHPRFKQCFGVIREFIKGAETATALNSLWEQGTELVEKFGYRVNREAWAVAMNIRAMSVVGNNTAKCLPDDIFRVWYFWPYTGFGNCPEGTDEEAWRESKVYSTLPKFLN